MSPETTRGTQRGTVCRAGGAGNLRKEGPGAAPTLLLEMSPTAPRPGRGPGHVPGAGTGHLPSSSVLSCSSTSVQSMREITPFCRDGRWVSEAGLPPPRVAGGCPGPLHRTAAHRPGDGDGDGDRAMQPRVSAQLHAACGQRSLCFHWGKKQFLTAGISQFSSYNPSTNLFINYLMRALN